MFQLSPLFSSSLFPSLLKKIEGSWQKPDEPPPLFQTRHMFQSSVFILCSQTDHQMTHSLLSVASLPITSYR